MPRSAGCHASPTRCSAVARPPLITTAHSVPWYTTRPGPGLGGPDGVSDEEPQPTAISASARRQVSFATSEA